MEEGGREEPEARGASAASPVAMATDDRVTNKSVRKQTGYNGTNGDKIVFPASAQDFTEMGSNTCGTWQM